MRCAVLLAGFLFALGALRAAESPAPEGLKLFLLIGQSNMAGRGKVEPADQVPHPRVFALNQQLAWVPAVDPLHWDKPEMVGVGLGSSFGRAIADADPQARVGLIPAAFGGTSLDQWKPGKELYTTAVARAKEAMKHGKLAGILWHQGEADSPNGDPNVRQVRTYAERFAAMITQLRSDLGAPDVPVIVGELGYFRPNQQSDALNAVLRELPKTVPRCAAVSADGLHDRGDHLHFDSPSLREFGRRYAKAYLELSSRR